MRLFIVKNTLLVTFCILVCMPIAYAELSQSDFEKIQSIVDKSINASEKRMREYIDLKIQLVLEQTKLQTRSIVEEEIHASEKRMKDYVDFQVGHLDKSITIQGGYLRKSVNRNFQLILALIGFVTVVVGIPQIIVVFQNRRYKLMSEDIDKIRMLAENNNT